MHGLTPKSHRDALRNAEILHITKGVRSELRALLNAVLEARLAESRARLDRLLAQGESERPGLALLRLKGGSQRRLPIELKMLCQHPPPGANRGSIQ
jgi:hypothetical protein